MRTPRSLLAFAALVASTVAVGAAACGSGAPLSPLGPNGVRARNLAFTPSTISVKVGDTVTWTFNDSVSHNVNGRSDLAGFFSGDLQIKGTYPFTFTKPGTYVYHCDNHPFMTGTVTVS